MEYPEQMFWLRNTKNNFQLNTPIWRPGHFQNREERVILIDLFSVEYYRPANEIMAGLQIKKSFGRKIVNIFYP